MNMLGHELFFIDKAIDTELYAMSNINRYAGRFVIKPENLAEHSYYVTVSVIKFGKLFNISEERINKAIRIALAHDLGETKTGDIPHCLKVYSPEVKKISEELEVKLIGENFPIFKEDFEDYYNNVDPIVCKLVELADIADVIMYINREETLGNRSEDILTIHHECNERFIKTKIDLENLIKENDKNITN